MADELAERKPKPGQDPKTGKFLPGNKLRPPTAVGRKKPDIGAALASIETHFPDEHIGERMMEVYELAIKMGSPKAALSVIELALAYRHGKPVTRQITASMTPEWFNRLFAPEGEEGEIVDVEGEI